MIKVNMYTTILTLYKQNMSQRQISKTTGVHRSTVSKIINRYDSDKVESPEPKSAISKSLLWHAEIIELLGKDMSYVRIYEELRGRGYDASYSSLFRYISKHNLKQKTCIRFHTDPGLEAQVDFGDIGKRMCPNGKMRRAYVFNMRLSYSRYDYFEIVFDQKVETWIRCHINAFNYFGGVPRVIKIDNLKAGVTDANFYEPLYQRQYKMMADHHNCSIAPCRPYQPQEKGKVESGIKYVKNNFFAGREFQDHDDMVSQLSSWLDIVNNRLHGTTKARPVDLFNDAEKEALIKLPTLDFDMSTWSSRKVAKDCHITFDNNYYSVPSKYVGMTVDLLVNNEVVKIYYDNEQIAFHARSISKGVFTTIESHYPKGSRYSPGFAEHDDKYESLMSKMGINCGLMFVALRKQHPRDWYRAVRGIVKLRDDYCDELIDKACLRALCYGAISYSKIKSILQNNCYDLPVHDMGGSYAGVA